MMVQKKVPSMHGISIVHSLSCHQIKCLVALTIFLYMEIGCCAQSKIDEAYLKCQYDYTYVEDTLSGKTAKDWLVLLLGKNVSKCYSYYSMQVDSIFASPDRDMILHQQINAAIGSKTEWPHKRMKAYVYKNYPQGKMTVTDGLLLQDYIYEDTLYAQNWVIQDSTKFILGHECQKAVCHYRGHSWTVWFAMDIPIADGPWKLCGLPGLIMEAASENNSHDFKILGLEKVTKEPIVFSKTYVGNNKFEKTTFSTFLREQYKFLFGGIFAQTQLLGVDIPNGEKVGSKSRKYKPLECW